MPDPVEGQLAAYNARDVEAFLPWFADDVVVEDGDGNLVLRGKDAMRARYGPMFAANPALVCTLVSRIRIGAADPRWVIDEESITGRSPTAEHAVAIYKVERDLITKVRFYR